MRRLFLAAWLIVCCAACRGTNVAPRARLRVAAAADLNAAFGEIASRFESSHPVDVDVTYGSSGTLYSQLANEAPFDLFFSADVDYPQRLARAGLTLPDGAFEYGVGRLVVWVAGSSPLDVAGLGVRALSDDGVRHVAIANPAHAPYGRAAIAALTSEHLDARVAPKLVYGENVGQALQFVQSGAADAGIVALSLALTPAGKSGRWFEIPQADYPPLRQGGAILKWAVDPAAARALRDLVVGAEGRSILQRYGFSPPAGQPPAPHVT
jgi:molybdate transport system substrate-binding protein